MGLMAKPLIPVFLRISLWMCGNKWDRGLNRLFTMTHEFKTLHIIMFNKSETVGYNNTNNNNNNGRRRIYLSNYPAILSQPFTQATLLLIIGQH